MAYEGFENARLRVLSSIFSTRAVRSIMSYDNGGLVLKILEESNLNLRAISDLKLSELFEVVYDLQLRHKIRTEYLYKNTLAKNLFLSRHSLSKSVFFQEHKLGNCVADALILNGRGHVFEIKTERDSLARLESQLSYYRRVFAHVTLVVASKHFDKAVSLTPSSVGISVINSRYQVSVWRECQEDCSELSVYSIARSLRRGEKKRVLKGLGVGIPELPNTKIDDELVNMLCNFDVNDVYSLAIEAIKADRSQNSLKPALDASPQSLSAIILNCFHRGSQALDFVLALDKRVSMLG